MATKITAAEAAEKYAERLAASTADIQRGVEAVQTAPGTTAAKNADKWFSGIQAAHTSGKWAKRVASVSVTDWKEATISKGIPRIGTGARAAVGKMTTFYGQLFPHIANGQSKIANMRNVTLEDSINRMVSFTRHMADFKRS